MVMKIVFFKYILEVSAILFGFNMTRLGNLIFNNVLQGRGYNIPYVISPNQYNDIKIIYPLSNNLIKEIILYNYYHNIWYRPENIFNENIKNVFSTVTSEFLSNLDSKFPSTLHTLQQTVLKLEKPTNNIIECPVCSQYIINYIIEYYQLKILKE